MSAAAHVPAEPVLDRLDNTRIAGNSILTPQSSRLGRMSGQDLPYEHTIGQQDRPCRPVETGRSVLLRRTLFHTTNVHYIPSARRTLGSQRHSGTIVLPHTAFRRFGGRHGSTRSNAPSTPVPTPRRHPTSLALTSSVIRRANMLRDGRSF